MLVIGLPVKGAITMKKKHIKIVVVPHYSGSIKTSEVFKRIISEQIEKKLKAKPHN